MLGKEFTKTKALHFYLFISLYSLFQHFQVAEIYPQQDQLSVYRLI